MTYEGELHGLALEREPNSALPLLSGGLLFLPAILPPSNSPGRIGSWPP
jgi:hypothetical protein